MNEILNPIFGSSSSEKNRFKLKQEQQNDLKQFLAQQASISHPRLLKLKKDVEIIGHSGSLFGRDDFIGRNSIGRDRVERDNRASHSERERHEREPERVSLRPIPQYQQTTSQQTYTNPPIYPPMGYQQMPPPMPPLQYSNPYLMPGSYAYPYEMYRNNPYGDPFQSHHPTNPYTFQPRPPPQPQSQYQDPRLERYSRSRVSSQQSPSPRLERQERMERTERIPEQQHHRGPQVQSKTEYARELQRQIEQKKKTELQEKTARVQPDEGFLGLRSEPHRRQSEQRSDTSLTNQDRMKQQHMYLKELDDQIRLKKEMLEREKRQELQFEYHEPEVMHSPVMLSQLDLSNRQRKQFPQEMAKLYNSTVFPNAPHKTSNVLNQYTALPAIGTQPPDTFMQSNFPPTDGTRTSFIRGSKNLQTMPQWEREEMLSKEDQRRKEQIQVQDVLRQQIAEKEQLKQRQKMEQRLEDEKEQQRLVKEQQLLYERYAREKEEQRKKEEQEMLEKQAKMAKQRTEQNGQAETYTHKTSKSAKARRMTKPPSPEPVQPIETTPFRSNSPPLPAQLKKMKEQGIDPQLGSEPDIVPASLQVTDNLPQVPFDDVPIKRNIQTAPFQETLMPRTPAPTEPHPKIQTITPIINMGQQDTLKILEQLAQIQKELQVENLQVQSEIQESEKMLERVEEQARFDSQLAEMDQVVQRPKSGYVPKEPSLPPTRTSLSAKYRRYKEDSDRMDFSIYQQPVEPVETRYKEPTEPEFSHYKEPVETHSHYKEAKDSHSLESYVPLPELTDTESQIMSISRNLQLPTSKQIQTPDTDFNLDEIERRNEERLKRFEMVHQPSTGNILDDFMNKRGEKSIPSSPSTYQPIPYEERY